MAAASSSVAGPSNFRTILSVVQEIASNDVLSERIHPLHPYSQNPETTINMLQKIINASNDIAGSLNAQVTLPLSNQKTLSLLRQQTQISHTVHNVSRIFLCPPQLMECRRQADQMIRQTVETLRKRVGILYGEDIPLDRNLLVLWFISKLEAWGTDAGMEAFKEDEHDGKITIMLGGKVIVVDITVAVNRTEPDWPKMSLASVKTSYAIPGQAQAQGSQGGGTTTGGSISLDGFMTDSLQAFMDEIQKDDELQDPERVARMATRMAEDVKYLMTLDHLALREGDQGLRWFTNMDLLSVHAEKVAYHEAESVAK